MIDPVDRQTLILSAGITVAVDNRTRRKHIIFYFVHISEKNKGNFLEGLRPRGFAVIAGRMYLFKIVAVKV